MGLPRVIVFSSGKTDRVADGVRENLRREHGGQRYEVDVWKDGFFNEENTLPLNTFLKRLLCFDVAVLILGADEIRMPEPGAKEAEAVPRDNVIFELGAAMARMGTRKTFVLTPNEPKVVPPSYFTGLKPLTYENRADGNTIAGTGGACAAIRETLRRLDADVYHSDLPAIGLAHGYFYNFVNAVYATLRERQKLTFPEGPRRWDPDDGFTLTVIIPESMINREAADKFLKGVGAVNIHLLLRDGRDVSAYVLPQTRTDKRLHILDIPTTLVTSAEVIDRVDSFWGGGDVEFKEDLARRERESFDRHLHSLRAKAQLDPSRVHIIPVNQLDGHLASLRAAPSPDKPSSRRRKT